MSRPAIFTTPCMYLDINGLQGAIIAAVPEVTAVLRKDDDILVYSNSELSQENKDLVNSTKMAFADSDPDQKTPKIYDIVKGEARHKHHHNIDYKKEVLGALIPVRAVTKGEVTKVDWYYSLNAQMQPENLVLTVDISYTRDASGFALNRTTTRTWVNRDDSNNSETKITPKFYFVNPSDMIAEGYRRRKLLVQSIQIPTLTFMTEALVPLGYTEASVLLKGRAFMDDYDEDFNKFVENSSTITDPADPDVGLKSIVVRLRDEATLEYVEWLDKAPPSLGGSITIRQYLMDEFDI